jgi:phosphoribosyl 1,2-cyclic phosphodiesterase
VTPDHKNDNDGRAKIIPGFNDKSAKATSLTGTEIEDEDMNIHFWGVRGSIATPLTNSELTSKIESALRKTIEVGFSDISKVSEFVKGLPWHVGGTVGGDTACVELKAGGELLILDAGTGIRILGLDLIRRYGPNGINAHVLLSHTHWDHICGFPFFAPANIPGKTVVYATDAEYQDLSQSAMKPYFEFLRGADILIFDAQYTMMESVEKENWGHSTAFVGIDIALEAGVKNLVFTHHEPTYDDQKLWRIFQESNRYLEMQRGDRQLALYMAYEGLEMEL